MRTFNYSAIRQQKWDSDVLGLIAAIYKEAGKQELYLKQRPEKLEKLVEIAKIEGALRKLVAAGELKKEGRGKNTNYILVPYEGQPVPEKIDYTTKLVGQRFGHLTVIEDSGERFHRAILSGSTGEHAVSAGICKGCGRRGSTHICRTPI